MRNEGGTANYAASRDSSGCAGSGGFSRGSSETKQSRMGSHRSDRDCAPGVGGPCRPSVSWTTNTTAGKARGGAGSTVADAVDGHDYRDQGTDRAGSGG